MSFRDITERGSELSLIGLFALALIVALYFSSTYTIPVVAAVLVGLTLGPAVDWLERRGINSYVASGALIVALAGILSALFYGLSAPFENWVARVPAMWERAVEELSILKGTLESLDDMTQSIEEASDQVDGETVAQVEITEGSILKQVISSVPVIVAQIITFLGALFFFLAVRTRMRLSFLSFCMAPAARLHTARIFRDVEFFLSRYVASITLVNIALGVATGLAMAAIGLPAPVLWGVLAAFLNFVPYIGPAIVAIVLTGVGLVTFDGLVPALLPAAIFLGLNLLEAQFVTPGVLGRTLTINPFAVFLSITFWLWLWGPVGALIAVPILIVMTVTVVHLLPRQERRPVRARFGKPAVAAARQQAAEDDADEAFETGRQAAAESP